MVVCKCRKATKLYCFVHKVPVCGECIISSEHQICVVKTYSEWVIDGDYDWPPKCSSCHETLQDGDNATIRLGCLHVFHTPCLVSYLQSFPPHTAPAGYVCPSCPAMIWPPKSIKDQSSALPSKLKEVILQSGLGKALLGSDVMAVQQPPPPAFSSAPLVSFSALAPVTASPDAATSEIISNGDFSLATSGHEANVSLGINLPASGRGGDIMISEAITEVDASSTAANGPHSSLTTVSFSKTGKLAPQLQPGAMTRKSSYRGEKPGSPYADNGRDDDVDGVRRKYSRRGHIHRHFLRNLLPFWSNAFPTLPVTAPARKDDRDAAVAEELIEGRSRRRQRSNTVDPRKILFLFAIMSCMATMMLLYYRLSQGATSENLPQVEEQ